MHTNGATGVSHRPYEESVDNKWRSSYLRRRTPSRPGAPALSLRKAREIVSVLREGQPVALTPKAFDLLVLLLSRQGRLIPREEPLSRLWPDSFVDESNLTGAIWAVRKALGPGERWIETVPNGYRFVGPAQEVRPPR